MKNFEDATEEERAMIIQPVKDAQDKQMKRFERSKNLEKLLSECFSLSKLLLGNIQKLFVFQKKFHEIIETLDNPKDIKLHYEETTKPVSVTTIDSSDPMFKEIKKEASEPKSSDPILLGIGDE